MSAPAFLRRFVWALPVAVAVLLGGCKASVTDENGQEKSASISFGNSDADSNSGADGNSVQGVSINVPGFSAKVDIPDLDLGSDMKIEDMKLFPGTKVTGMKITGEPGADHREAKGNVDMGFAAPGNAADVVNYYKAEARRTGWDATPATGSEQFAAAKANDHGGTARFALEVAPGPGGSQGHLLVTGR